MKTFLLDINNTLVIHSLMIHKNNCNFNIKIYIVNMIKIHNLYVFYSGALKGITEFSIFTSQK